jgi:hypothetical protein
MGGKRGFLAFALAAVLLASIVISASAFQQGKAASSQSGFAALDAKLQSVAIKSAAYQAFSDAARIAHVSATAAGEEPRPAIRAALYSQALFFAQELGSQGAQVEFWCGFPSESSLSDAPFAMLEAGKPLAPQGALPLSNPECFSSFDVDMGSKALAISNLGFSLYSGRLGYAEASRFPPGKKVGF